MFYIIINTGSQIELFLLSRKGAESREGDLITHVDIICHYSNEFDTTILYLHRLRLSYYCSVINIWGRENLFKAGSIN